MLISNSIFIENMKLEEIEKIVQIYLTKTFYAKNNDCYTNITDEKKINYLQNYFTNIIYQDEPKEIAKISKNGDIFKYNNIVGNIFCEEVYTEKDDIIFLIIIMLSKNNLDNVKKTIDGWFVKGYDTKILIIDTNNSADLLNDFFKKRALLKIAHEYSEFFFNILIIKPPKTILNKTHATNYGIRVSSKSDYGFLYNRVFIIPKQESPNECLKKIRESKDHDFEINNICTFFPFVVWKKHFGFDESLDFEASMKDMLDRTASSHFVCNSGMLGGQYQESKKTHKKIKLNCIKTTSRSIALKYFKKILIDFGYNVEHTFSNRYFFVLWYSLDDESFDKIYLNCIENKNLFYENKKFDIVNMETTTFDKAIKIIKIYD